VGTTGRSFKSSLLPINESAARLGQPVVALSNEAYTEIVWPTNVPKD
jgi:hypothetical protein